MKKYIITNSKKEKFAVRALNVQDAVRKFRDQQISKNEAKKLNDECYMVQNIRLYWNEEDKRLYMFQDENIIEKYFTEEKEAKDACNSFANKNSRYFSNVVSVYKVKPSSMFYELHPLYRVITKGSLNNIKEAVNDTLKNPKTIEYVKALLKDIDQFKN